MPQGGLRRYAEVFDGTRLTNEAALQLASAINRHAAAEERRNDLLAQRLMGRRVPAMVTQAWLQEDLGLPRDKVRAALDDEGFVRGKNARVPRWLVVRLRRRFSDPGAAPEPPKGGTTNAEGGRG